VTDRYEYDAFGNSFTVSGTTPNNYLYRGEQHDADLGLYYLRARYYNPQSGRFTGVDPLSDQGEPRYEYAGADPVDGIDSMGTEDLTECALLGSNGLGTCSAPRVFQIPPPWCQALSGDSFLGDLPQCKKHWTVRVDYRPILSGKLGCDNDIGIPSCDLLPLGFWEHSYVEIDGPDDAPEGESGGHTWGVLGIKNGNPEERGSDQEMVHDQTAWDRDPLYTAAGVRSQIVYVSDRQAQWFEQALNGVAWPHLPRCPSCGDPYHNGPVGSPRRHLHLSRQEMFSAYNSNTFTWNVIANFLQVTPPPIGNNAPGYHYSAGYEGYP